IALLTNAPQLAAFQDLRRDGQLEISLYGQTPTILTFSSENQPRRNEEHEEGEEKPSRSSFLRG
ncbi:MAG TPA: hypothetical protein VG324_02235, partial [Blastocatellia bacterium]|nr:hypothetical protein [Blastocatellia bacterium]